MNCERTLSINSTNETIAKQDFQTVSAIRDIDGFLRLACGLLVMGHHRCRHIFNFENPMWLEAVKNIHLKTGLESWLKFTSFLRFEVLYPLKLGY